MYIYEIFKGNCSKWNKIEDKVEFFILEDLYLSFQKAKEKFPDHFKESKIQQFDVFYLPAITLNLRKTKYMFLFNKYCDKGILVSPIELKYDY